MTLTQLQKWLDEFEHNTIQQCKTIMENEVPVGLTHGLKNSIVIEAQGHGLYRVGSHKEYASYVNYGRGPVDASPGKWLHWVDPQYGSIFTKHVRASRPNDFKARTIRAFKAYVSSYR